MKLVMGRAASGEMAAEDSLSDMANLVWFVGREELQWRSLQRDGEERPQR